MAVTKAPMRSPHVGTSPQLRCEYLGELNNSNEINQPARKQQAAKTQTLQFPTHEKSRWVLTCGTVPVPGGHSGFAALWPRLYSVTVTEMEWGLGQLRQGSARL